MAGIFTAEDLEQIRARGMTVEHLLAQIALFKQGIPFVHLLRPCTVGDGITVLSHSEVERLATVYARAAAAGRVMKFVPASGAATRMFALLQAHARGATATNSAEMGEDVHLFFRRLHDFAFYDELCACLARDGMTVAELLARGDYRTLITYILTPRGLDYARLPKGLIQFHRYGDRARTPFEEHLAEAVGYTLDRERRARVHFTVAPEYIERVQAHVERACQEYRQSGVQLEVTFSVQKPSTDTIAVDAHNMPVRDAHGRLVFRPGGHGALLENLNDLRGDIVFIKNIDNVAPAWLAEEICRYKRALGGYLVEVQGEVFTYLEALSNGKADESLLRRGFEFVRARLSLSPPDAIVHATRGERRRFLVQLLQRPLRVCGVVQNRGEPGGGPFWVADPQHGPSLRIVESAEVDMSSPQQRAVWESATHFNPVDLVCGVRDYRGEPFDLAAFADRTSGLITVKSQDGRLIKALELPGLWNGGMAYWNTVFVEVPLVTFNPVKTVLDLLRQEHQPG
ncbi:MAG: DUF4301 family protein [Candidatus Binatia bacterium]|nr:DUF4301 family protein [Candidatus Binatia bacterium]